MRTRAPSSVRRPRGQSVLDQHSCDSGDDGTRTHDPLLAKQDSPFTGPGRFRVVAGQRTFRSHVAAHCSHLERDELWTLCGLSQALDDRVQRSTARRGNAAAGRCGGRGQRVCLPRLRLEGPHRTLTSPLISAPLRRATTDNLMGRAQRQTRQPQGKTRLTTRETTGPGSSSPPR